MTDINVLKEIQLCLKSVGLYTGAIDGIFGWQSYSAVLALSKETTSKNKSVKNLNKIKTAAKDIQNILIEQHKYFDVVDGIFGGNSMTAFNSLLPAPKLNEVHLNKVYKNILPGLTPYINQFAPEYHIQTKADLCAFLANNIHESRGFKSLRENMNYSAPRLLQVFPKYFKTLAAARAVVARGPIAICDVVYGGRMGNGVNNGDGYKYRGGGSIHLTGKENYTLCSIGIGLGSKLLEDPDLLTQPEYAVKSAFWFWNKNRCSRAVNRGDFQAACKIVNGGTNGMAEREALFAKAWSSIF